MNGKNGFLIISVMIEKARSTHTVQGVIIRQIILKKYSVLNLKLK